MDAQTALIIVSAYFALLFIISLITSRGADENTFFTGDHSSPWFVVAFGMIGASLSGVTFISVPGAVGGAGFGYMQMVFGFLLGYLVIALVLMPLYYRLKLTSIYQYLDGRFGPQTYKTGAVFFLLSRIIGASLRLFLVAVVLQLAICDELGIPFEVTVLVSIALIYLYTFRGGIKTVVWTDTLQTFFMLLSAGYVVYLISRELDLSPSELITTVQQSDYSQMFFWEWRESNYFWKQLLSGMFMAIVMTGLDQDMMQKNLSCKNLKDAQKNMYSFSVVLIFANLLFLSLGVLLYTYGSQLDIIDPVFIEDCKIRIMEASGGFATGDCITTDKLFPFLALNHLGVVAAGIFIIGIIAAAYSSADSALTALTTSFCIDILDFEKKTDLAQKEKTRRFVHVGFAAILFVVVVAFSKFSSTAVIWEIFKAAGYTYGPLLGLYAFGLFSKWKIQDQYAPFVCIAAPILSYAIQKLSPMLFDYSFGFEILLVNAGLTYLGLMLIRDGREIQ